MDDVYARTDFTQVEMPPARPAHGTTVPTTALHLVDANKEPAIGSSVRAECGARIDYQPVKVTCWDQPDLCSECADARWHRRGVPPTSERHFSAVRVNLA